MSCDETALTADLKSAFVASGAIDASPLASLTSGMATAICTQIDSAVSGVGYYQTVQAAGVGQTQRGRLNFLTGFVVTDNAGNSSTDIALPTIYYQRIQDAGVDKTQRATLDFDSGFTITDDAGSDRTKVAVAFPTTYNQTVQDNGTPKTQRAAVNFIGFTVADDSGSGRTNITTPTVYYQRVQDAGVDKTQRAKLDFDSGFTITDDSGNDRTKIAVAFPTTYYQTVQDAGVDKTQRSKLDFDSGFTVTDDSANGRTKIAVAFPTTYYQTVRDNGTDKTQRSKVNFVGFTVADDSGNDQTTITSPTVYNQTVQDNGTDKTQRAKINFIGLTVTDDSGGNRTTVTYTAPTLYNQTIQAAGVDQTQRSKLDFDGTDFTLTDDSGGNRTKVAMAYGYDAAAHSGGGLEVQYLTGTGGVVGVRGTAALAFGSTPATQGNIRLPKDGVLGFRYADNSKDGAIIGVDGSNNVYVGDFVNGAGTTLAFGSSFGAYIGGATRFSVSASTITSALLSGTGTRYVTANASGDLGTTTIPTLYYQTVQDNGSNKTQRSKVNFVGFTVADDSGNDRTTVTAPSLGWRSLYDYDLTSASTLAASGNGNFTIDGKTWTIENFANASAIGLVNGTGFRINNNSTNSDYTGSTRTAPMISIPLSSLTGSLLLGPTAFRLWLYFAHTADQNFEGVHWGLEFATSASAPFITTTSQSMECFRGWNSTAGAARWGFPGAADQSNNTSDDVVVLECLTLSTFRWYTGAYSAGWPSSLTNRFTSMQNSPSLDARIAFICKSTNTAGNMTSAIKRIKIEAYQL